MKFCWCDPLWGAASQCYNYSNYLLSAFKYSFKWKEDQFYEMQTIMIITLLHITQIKSKMFEEKLGKKFTSTLFSRFYSIIYFCRTILIDKFLKHMKSLTLHFLHSFSLNQKTFTKMVLRNLWNTERKLFIIMELT